MSVLPAASPALKDNRSIRLEKLQQQGPPSNNHRVFPPNLLVFIAKHHPDDADGDAERRQQQHADLGPLVEVRQVVFRDPWRQTFMSSLWVQSPFSQKGSQV